jgi:hypothetical protein
MDDEFVKVLGGDPSSLEGMIEQMPSLGFRSHDEQIGESVYCRGERGQTWALNSRGRASPQNRCSPVVGEAHGGWADDDGFIARDVPGLQASGDWAGDDGLGP